MTAKGEARRALLGEAVVQAAREAARQAPTPSPELLEVLRVLLRNARPRRQDAA